MRLYSFVNYYLSPLQRGLQTAHCVSDMSMEYADSDPRKDAYSEWAAKHKRIVICDGGNTQQLEDLHLKLVDFAHYFKLPLVKFYEDEQSLNGALTAVAIVVPEEMGGATKGVPKFEPATPFYVYQDPSGAEIQYKQGSKEFALIDLVKSYRLA